MACGVLSGCHHLRLNPFASSAKSCHKPQPYQKARDVPPLKIPEGMDSPDSTTALRLPQLKAVAPPARSGSQPCLDEPPPFKVAKSPAT
ncbi:MAG: hypothetical protein JSR67_10275 [Proteobacteria bacterium]|nr:hypothetical protein [Pseudomonadota bacterium]